MKYLILTLALFSNSVLAASFSFTDHDFFIVPTGVRSIAIDVYGGFGGNGSSCYPDFLGGAGIHGAHQRSSLSVYPGEKFQIIVDRGAPGVCGGGNGGQGGQAQFYGNGFSLRASGGQGGAGTGGNCDACGTSGGDAMVQITY